MKTRLAVALASLLALPGLAHAEPALAHQSFKLANGLQVYVLPDHAAPSLAVVTWYKVGSKDELPGRTGFAHLFEHLMFKGSAHAPDGLIDVLFESAGGWTNAYTSNDETVYTDVAAPGFLEGALWLEADRLAGLTQTLDQAKLDNQRDVVRNERRQSYENRPYGMAELLIVKNLWPKGHPYSWPVIGEHADLVAASTADVSKFFDTHYLPNNATLVLAGDIDPKQAKALVTKYFSWIPAGTAPESAAVEPPARIAKEIVLADTDDVQVPKVFFAWRGPTSYSAEEPGLDLAAWVLASGKTSRLYKRLVFDDRVAQDVEAGFSPMKLGGTFEIAVTAKPGVDPAKITKAVDEEIARLSKDPPSAEELERAKNLREALFLSGLEPLLARAEKLAEYDVMTQDPNYLAKDLERFRAVAPADITALVKKYLPTNARVRLTISPKPAASKGGK